MKKNFIIGALWLVIFLLLGFVLEVRLSSSDPAWLQSETRVLWRTAPVHGNLFGFLNILLALVVGHFGARRAFAVGSWLAFLAALVFPTALFLASFARPVAYFAPVGGWLMILAWAFVAYGVLTGRKE